MGQLHEELRKAREKAGLSQQALADRSGVPRNQIVRAEKGENITIDTLRRITLHLPVSELSLLDTREFRVDIIPEPEKLLFAAMENVMQLTVALRGAMLLALEAKTAADIARRATPPLPDGSANPYGKDAGPDADPTRVLQEIEQVVTQVEAISKGIKALS